MINEKFLDSNWLGVFTKKSNEVGHEELQSPNELSFHTYHFALKKYENFIDLRDGYMSVLRYVH